MKIKNMGYMMKEGLKGFWRHRMMGIASIISIASMLTILGVIFILVLNVNSMAQITKDQFDSIPAYLDEGLDEVEIQKIGQDIGNIKGVKSISFESKEEALKNMKKDWGENGYLLEGLEKNPLPNTYVITLSSIEDANHVVEQVKNIEGLEKVKYHEDIIQQVIKITRYIYIGGSIIIGVLIFVSIFVVGNTIKLTVIARKREINIMKYVGATNWFVRWPFLIEGSLLGLLGAIIASSIIGTSYYKLGEYIEQKLYVMISIYMIPATVVLEHLVIIFIVLGIGIGALGSIFSMRKFLRV